MAWVDSQPYFQMPPQVAFGSYSGWSYRPPEEDKKPKKRKKDKKAPPRERIGFRR